MFLCWWLARNDCNWFASASPSLCLPYLLAHRGVTTLLRIGLVHFDDEDNANDENNKNKENDDRNNSKWSMLMSMIFC